MSENIIEKMVRDFQDRIITGTFEGIYALPEAERDQVMACQAGSCAVAWAELYGIPAELELGEFLERLRMGGSSKIEIEQLDPTENSGWKEEFLWRELHEGQCICPLVTRGVIPLDSALCGCAEHWARMLLERHVVGAVEVETVESAARGDRNCTFHVRIGDCRHP